ncbi:MAG: DNA polymerase III subunit alpha [Bacilli bacterium]
MNYYQLNTLTGYSFGQSIVLPDQYAKRAKELGYSGIGSADNNVYVFPSLEDSAKTESLKSICGYRTKLFCSSTVPFDAVIYVLSEKGYLNLCQIISQKKDILGTEVLNKYNEGLALVIDCSNENYKDEIFLGLAAPSLLEYSHIFKDNYYFGVSIYSKDDQEEIKNLYTFCSNCQYKTVAFPQVSYLKKSDSKEQFLFSKAFQKETVTETPEDGPYFLLSPKSLDLLYRKEDLKAVEELVDKVSFTFFASRGKLFTFKDDDQTLNEESHAGLKKILGNHFNSSYENRLSYELQVIKNMHFSSYFLLVSDYVNYARSIGIKVGVGRGSAGGSLVSFALNITEIDPIRFDLSFERFLNPKRQNMPDIDVDFEDTRRNEVVDYLRRKYGEEHVSDIITFIRLKPKSALNLIGPAIGFNATRLKKLSSMISDRADDFSQALTDKMYGYRLRNLLRDPYYQDLVSKATPLIGLPVTTSQHPVGVILSENIIYESCPVSEGTKGITEFEYPNMERTGFLKADILALSNLTFIKEIEDKITADHKEIPNLWNDLDDEETYKTLNRLDLAFIFQLGNYGMRQTTETIKPTCFKDLASILALYRPGAMAYIDLFAQRKNNHEPIVYLDKCLEPILKDTYGIMLYQEQVIEAVKAVGGFDSGDADIFRRAISKKNLSKMEAYKEKFLLGAKQKGIKEDKAQSIYKDIEKFAGYGFNKSHAYSYSFITYQLLYYKTHFPEEFYRTAFDASSLSSEDGIKIRYELLERKIQVTNPHINISSLKDLIFKEDKAYVPFRSINGLDLELMTKIVKDRETNGPYKSFYDFCLRNTSLIDLKGEKTVEALISSGAFDSFMANREAMRSNLNEWLGFARMGFEEKKLPDISSTSEDIGKQLFLEKSALGVILSIKLTSIYAKPPYKTMIVSDDSREELEHVVMAIDENKEYRLELSSNPSIEKNSFVLVKADFKRKWVKPLDIINMKVKVKK